MVAADQRRARQRQPRIERGLHPRFGGALFVDGRRTGISIRAHARLRGVALSAVQKAIKTKRITPDADGTIDPERANYAWERNTFAGKTLH